MKEACRSMAGASTFGGGYLLPRAFLYWLPLALCTTVLAGLVYVAVQQSFRQGANDPQIQIVEDAAAQLEAGQQPGTVVGSSTVDMAHSLATYLIVYDEAGHVLASSVQLNGNVPSIPPGVLTAARQSGENRLTWQPQEGVRSAAVVTYFEGSHPGFVLAGRSLREVENRVYQLTQIVGLAWVVALAGSFALWLAGLWLNDRLIRQPTGD
jgi:hypothetical protein